jgi:hypothetical protein
MTGTTKPTPIGYPPSELQRHICDLWRKGYSKEHIGHLYGHTASVISQWIRDVEQWGRDTEGRMRQ